MKMSISDTVTSYLTKITQIRDEFVVVGKNIEDQNWLGKNHMNIASMSLTWY
jgi:hypothetical protein